MKDNQNGREQHKRGLQSKVKTQQLPGGVIADRNEHLIRIIGESLREKIHMTEDNEQNSLPTAKKIRLNCKFFMLSQ